MLTFFGKRPQGKGGDSALEATAALQVVRGYWEALRSSGGLPSRAQLDPRGMADCLDKVFLIEQIAPGLARFRLAGMLLNDLMGMDLRGMPLSALFEPVARTRMAQELDQVFQAQAILQIGLEAERSIGRPALSGQMLLLPLAGVADAPKVALGCLTTEGTIGRQPRRFALSGVVREALAGAGLRVVTEVAATALDEPAPPRTFGRADLRLVSSRT
ncbi:PAS domain-containing protein [Cypionkella aquatica]|uniref:PAS domain-containing protein n=1 Tax=Cypionkella aquatica TaxID=1756042 RepID=A0AA37U9R6_9RHOB|nr:PAS domain-containing protein [Cypionkella aquatica]GLS87791.1 PAS domain-containing protein [Cypionkella aquatica]